MRRSLMLLATSSLALLAIPASAGNYSLNGWTAPSGQAETFTLTRVDTSTNELFQFKTMDGSAKAGIDYTAVNEQVTLVPGQASVAISVPTSSNMVAAGQTLNFTVVATLLTTPIVSAGANIVEPPPPPVNCWDGTTVQPPVACPSDNPTTGQALGVGAHDIATTDHNVDDDLQPSWGSGAIPGSNAPDVVGAERFICRHTNLAYDDPTVFPGKPGASHLHDQTGVYGWNAFSNYVNLRVQGGGSGCNDLAGTDHDATKSSHAANHTPYWQPALLDGKGNVILADYTSFYYKARPFAGALADPLVSDPTNLKFVGKGVPLPNGLKFIFGGFSDSTKTPVPAFVPGCIDPTGHPMTTDGTFAGAVQCVKSNNAALIAAGKAPGYQLEMHQTAPNCWDGLHLDSADHRSHLSYGKYYNGVARCPPGYGYIIPAFTYGVFYTILPSDDGDIHFSSDEMDNSKPRGWSFHVDYGPAAWDPKVLAMWTDNCINKMLNCSGGDLGNGKQLKGASQPIYLLNGIWTKSYRNPQRLVPVPPMPMAM